MEQLKDAVGPIPTDSMLFKMLGLDKEDVLVKPDYPKGFPPVKKQLLERKRKKLARLQKQIG